MNYYIDSKRYTNEEKQEYLNCGIYVNDLRGFDGSEEKSNGFIATIESSVSVNQVGSIMTKDIVFEIEPNVGVFDMKVIDFEYFEQNNKEVFQLADL